MSDLQTALNHLAERGSHLGSQRLRERVALEIAGASSRSMPKPIPKWAIAVAAATATVVLVGGPLVLFGGPDTSDTAQPPLTAVVDGPANVLSAGEWSDALTTTVAGAAPPAATCASGATPDLPGASAQDRPAEGPWNNQAAVFDRRAGRIVFVDEAAETWTFDVCTNHWEWMDPEGRPIAGSELVYDIDSDRTIAFSVNHVHVYDANANSWSRRLLPGDIIGTSFGVPGLGAVYDPSSGLVLLITADGRLTAYDVEADSWTLVGPIAEVRQVLTESGARQIGPPFLIGYMPDVDRLVFLGFGDRQGKLVNPRTGESAIIDAPDGGVWGGFGSFRYATGAATAYTYGEGVCRLDPSTLAWDCTSGLRQAEGPSAMVYDSINDRIVVINDHCCNWPGTSVTDGVSAIDFENGIWIELLPAARARTETDGS